MTNITRYATLKNNQNTLGFYLPMKHIRLKSNSSVKEDVTSSLKYLSNDLSRFSSQFWTTVQKDFRIKYNKFIEQVSPYPKVDYLEAFGIPFSHEETYTKFLEWLFDPEASHNYKSKPLNVFLSEIVDHQFNFDLKGIEIIAQKGKKGKIPDLLLKGHNFNCVIEIKIGSGEGEKQTPSYYKIFKGEPLPVFFIYLTLDGENAKKWGNGRDGFKSVKWERIINCVLVPLLQDINSPAREIIRSVIFNLKMNKISTRRSYIHEDIKEKLKITDFSFKSYLGLNNTLNIVQEKLIGG